jgi:AraC-like DNA-binding protein
MAANTTIQVSELDFDNIKSSLKTFLQSQSRFADYDFEGSNMSVLIDLLAYNTHYMTYFLNMVASESHLETAQLRNSVVEIAKELGYTPTSNRGATARIRLTVTPSNNQIETVTVPRDTKFTATVDNQTLAFSTPITTQIIKNANSAFVSTLNITEGDPLTHRFPVTTSTSKYVLPNKDVDTTSIRVRVQVSSGDLSNTTYIKADSINTLTANSAVYFLEEGSDDQYQIRFGDNTIGKKPVNGNIIIVDYKVSNGPLGNGANSFSLSGSSIDGHTNTSFTLVEAATGGVNKESISSIKFNAPKNYETQNRAVTVNDYRSIVLRDNPDIQSIIVWGGEDNDPPLYGKVLLSMKPRIGTILGEDRKSDIITSLKKYNVMSIDPEIVDASYTYIEPTVNVSYDSNATSLTGAAIADKVASKIIQFESDKLGIFDRSFRYSQLVRYIDDADTSIVGNLTSLKLHKKFQPNTSVATTYRFNFDNSIEAPGEDHPSHDGHHGITSSTFTYNGVNGCKIDDDGNGVLRIFYISATGSLIYLNRNAGTVDYSNGIVVLKSILISAYTGNEMEVSVTPSINDITSRRNRILLFDNSRIVVTDINTNAVAATVTSVQTAGATVTANDQALSTVIL